MPLLAGMRGLMTYWEKNMQPESNMKRFGDFLRRSPMIKVCSIGLLVLVLCIPTMMVYSLMRERESRRDDVVREINQKWGGSQKIIGPFLTIPFKNYRTGYFHVLPKSVKITGEIDPKIRYRSLYETVLYNTRVKMEGTFDIPPLDQAEIKPDDVFWDKAALSIGISDMKGIQDEIAISCDGADYKASPGLKTDAIASSGVHSLIPLSATKKHYTFSLTLNVNGSEQLQFTPVGEDTTVTLTSPWPSPSFNGAFLPASRKIDENGFAASWHVLHFNRNFPQLIGPKDDYKYSIGEAAFGLRLLLTADIYQKAIRVSKYAIMFIVFTYVAFFLSEILTKKAVHPIQYLLVGLAIILFYVLLLSISEYINFDIAYLLSAAGVTALITGYAKGFQKSNRFAISVFSILAILYLYLYIVLQLADYALVVGSLGLFAVLALVMYTTRKIDWYSLYER